MKKTILILFSFIGITCLSQTSFDINFQRSVIASQINTETDSLFSDKAEIRIFENNSISSVTVKFYNYVDSSFSEVHNSTIPFSSLDNNACASEYCMYKLNASIIVVNLGSRGVNTGKHKVYIEINAVSGKPGLIKEVEL